MCKKLVNSFTLTLAIAFIATNFIPTAFAKNLAATLNTDVLYSTTEILDEAVLYDRAINGISDVSEEVLRNVTQNVSVQYTENGIIHSVENSGIATTQLVSEIQNRSGEIEKQYVTTLFNDMILQSDKHGELTLQPRSNYTKEDEGVDGNNSCRTTVKIYYSTGTTPSGGQPDVPYITLTAVQATWSALTSNVSVGDKQLQGEYSGISLDAENFVHSYTEWFSTTNDTLRINLTSPEKIEDGNFIYFLIGTAKCTIYSKQPGRQWDLTVECRQTQGF